jgi:hypothetical protein
MLCCRTAPPLTVTELIDYNRAQQDKKKLAALEALSALCRAAVCPQQARRCGWNRAHHVDS